MPVRTTKLLKSLNKQLNEHFRWFSTSVVVLIVLIGFALFLQPKISEIREGGLLDLQSSRDRLELKRQLLAVTTELTKKYTDLRLEDVAKLQAVLPKTPDIPSLFVQIDALAQDAGLRVTNMSFAEPAPQAEVVRTPAAATPEEAVETTTTTPTSVTRTNEIKRLSVSFTVGGGRGYENLKQFLTNVESSLRLFDIQSLTYSPPVTQLPDGETYTINALTYYFTQ